MMRLSITSKHNKTLTTFYKRAPLFLPSLFVLCTTYVALCSQFIALLPLGVILLLLPTKQRYALLLLFPLLLLRITSTIQLPQLPPEGMLGSAHLYLTSERENNSHIGKGVAYRGFITSFHPKNRKVVYGKNVPIAIYLPIKKSISLPGLYQEYFIDGTLKKGYFGNYIFKPEKKQTWHPLQEKWNFSATRTHFKEQVKQYLKKSLPDEQAASFLSGIVTGDFDPTEFTPTFSRFGLQHILAISGFHFAILAATLSILFALFLPKAIANPLLILLLTLYFLFIGPTPSILRAWLMSSIFLLAWQLQREPNSINSLGAALLVIALYDPLLTLQIGFQLSFAATAAILFFYPLLETAFKKVIYSRSFRTILIMPLHHQLAYPLLIYMRKSLALTFAVSIGTTPLLLYYFHQYPLMSLAFNLFFPLLTSLSLSLLILASLISCLLPAAGAFLHTVNSHYTQAVLNLTFHTPTSFDYLLYSPPFSLSLLTCMLIIIFSIAIFIDRDEHKIALL